MAKFDEPIRDLLTSAQANTGENRALVYRHVVRMLCNPGDIASSSDLNLLLDIYDALAPYIDASVRQLVARHVAESGDVAPQLIERLAVDGVKIAAPIIRKSTIDDAALLRIVRRTGKAHHLMIAERADLSPAVWKALSHGEAAARQKTQPIFRKKKYEPEVATRRSGDERQESAARETFRSLKKLTDLAAEVHLDLDPSPQTDRQLEPMAELEPDQGGAELQDQQAGVTVRSRKVVLPAGPGFKRKSLAMPAATTSDGNSSPPVRGQRMPPDDHTSPGAFGATTFIWQTDRQGRIVMVSDGAYRAFGRAADTMTGLYFFALIEPAGEDRDVASLGRILARHLPIREFDVEIEADNYRRSIWRLTGRACFDRATGRFGGYEGRALAVDEVDRQPVVYTNATEALSGSVLQHFGEEIRSPVSELLKAAEHLSRRARKKNDRAAMGDLLIVLDAGYRLKTMAEDVEFYSRPEAAASATSRTAFAVRAMVADCLHEDAARHGGLSRFRLRSDSADALINFDEGLVRRALLRALEVVRSRGGYLHDPGIAIDLGNLGQIEISVPTGSGGRYQDHEEILHSPIDTIARRDSFVLTRDGGVFSAELGLSIAREKIRAAGGDVRIEPVSSDERAIVLSFPLGS